MLNQYVASFSKESTTIPASSQLSSNPYYLSEQVYKETNSDDAAAAAAFQNALESSPAYQLGKLLRNSVEVLYDFCASSIKWGTQLFKSSPGAKSIFLSKNQSKIQALYITTSYYFELESLTKYTASIFKDFKHNEACIYFIDTLKKLPLKNDHLILDILKYAFIKGNIPIIEHIIMQYGIEYVFHPINKTFLMIAIDLSVETDTYEALEFILNQKPDFERIITDNKANNDYRNILEYILLKYPKKSKVINLLKQYHNFDIELPKSDPFSKRPLTRDEQLCLTLDFSPRSRWNSKVIAIAIDPYFNEEENKILIEAINEYTKFSAIHFKWLSNEQDADIKIVPIKKVVDGIIGESVMPADEKFPYESINLLRLALLSDLDYFKNLIWHEAGHLLGAIHPFEISPERYSARYQESANFSLMHLDSVDFTVMGYKTRSERISTKTKHKARGFIIRKSPGYCDSVLTWHKYGPSKRFMDQCVVLKLEENAGAFTFSSQSGDTVIDARSLTYPANITLHSGFKFTETLGSLYHLAPNSDAKYLFTSPYSDQIFIRNILDEFTIFITGGEGKTILIDENTNTPGRVLFFRPGVDSIIHEKDFTDFQEIQLEECHENQCTLLIKAKN